MHYLFLEDGTRGSRISAKHFHLSQELFLFCLTGQRHAARFTIESRIYVSGRVLQLPGSPLVVPEGDRLLSGPSRQ